MEKNNKMQNIPKVDPDSVAEFFLAFANETGEPITNLKLQKLVYYAQAWYLANFSKPLFDEDFEAWVHGPVLPRLYHMFKERGSAPIETQLTLAQVNEKLPPEVVEFLTEIAKVYLPYTGYQLELMTHVEQPWQDARNGAEPDEKSTTIIPKDSMIAFYGQKILHQTN